MVIGKCEGEVLMYIVRKRWSSREKEGVYCMGLGTEEIREG